MKKESGRIRAGISWLRSRPWYVFVGVIGLSIGVSVWGIQTIQSRKSSAVSYQTQAVEEGTIVSSLSVSGQVYSQTSASISTQTSGVVKKIYVANGQRVQTGDGIAEVELDLEGKQRSSQAYASYQSAKNSLENAKATYYSLRSDMLTKWKSYMDAAQSSTYENPDKSPKTAERQLPQFYTISDDWLFAEAKMKNQDQVIAQAQTSLQSAWLSYQQASPVIYAPISGTVSGLSLQVGSVLTSQSNSSGTAASQKIASIETDAFPMIQVLLSEADVIKVSVGDRATVTLDALTDKTFTGTVVSIDTVGSISSGVTSYPAYITLDTRADHIYPNMSAQANIILDVRNQTLMVPSSAIITQDEVSQARVMKGNQIEWVIVETGISSDSQTEILSGLSKGDIVVTSTQQTTTATSTNRTSVFGGFGNVRTGGMPGMGR